MSTQIIRQVDQLIRESPVLSTQAKGIQFLRSEAGMTPPHTPTGE